MLGAQRVTTRKASRTEHLGGTATLPDGLATAWPPSSPAPSHGRSVRRCTSPRRGAAPQASTNRWERSRHIRDAPAVPRKQLREAGVHFGHQTRRWNPKMRRFIFGERNGIYIIDLQQTLSRIETAYSFVRDLVADGGTLLFIGTKKEAQDPIESYDEKCVSPDDH